MIKQLADWLRVTAKRGLNGRFLMLDGGSYRVRKIALEGMMISQPGAEGFHKAKVGQVGRKQGAADDA